MGIIMQIIQACKGIALRLDECLIRRTHEFTI